MSYRRIQSQLRNEARVRSVGPESSGQQRPWSGESSGPNRSPACFLNPSVSIGRAIEGVRETNERAKMEVG